MAGHWAPSVEPGQLWRHYKGHLYEVLDIVHHTELRSKPGGSIHSEPETHVVYREVKDGAREPDPRKWCRPLRMWNEQVETESYHSAELDQGVQKPTKPRFSYEPALTRQQPMRCG